MCFLPKKSKSWRLAIMTTKTRMSDGLLGHSGLEHTEKYTRAVDKLKEKHISTIQNTLQAQAAHAVNLTLTSSNWPIGYYIVEFGQNGEDRAAYGEQLLKKLEKRLKLKG